MSDKIIGVTVGTPLNPKTMKEKLKPMESEYELIETIELTEDTVSIYRTLEPDGTPYKFDAIWVLGNNVGLVGSGKYGFGVHADDNAVGAGGSLSAQTNNHLLAHIWQDRGIWDRSIVFETGERAWNTSKATFRDTSLKLCKNYPHITSLNIRQLNGVAMTAGSYFEIWGVRA